MNSGPDRNEGLEPKDMVNDKTPEAPDLHIDNQSLHSMQATRTSFVFMSDLFSFRSHPADQFSISHLTTE